MTAEYLLTESTPSTPTTSYLTNDTLGSPRVITDASGNVQSRRDFMPFGEEISGLGSRTSGLGYQTDATRQKFTGYERDSETNLDFAQSRYFNSTIGRFSSPDSFVNDTYTENPASWNLYVYVTNNPLKFIDPNGKAIWIQYFDENGAERKVQYKNGKLYYENGEQYTGQDKYILTVYSQLNQLKEDDEEAFNKINALEKSKNDHIITRYVRGEQNDGDKVDPFSDDDAENGRGSGSYIRYDPFINELIDGAPASDKRVVFAHELSHAFDTDRGQSKSIQIPRSDLGVKSDTSEVQDIREIRAVHQENKIRAKIGDPLRTSYGKGRISPQMEEDPYHRHRSWSPFQLKRVAPNR